MENKKWEFIDNTLKDFVSNCSNVDFRTFTLDLVEYYLDVLTKGIDFDSKNLECDYKNDRDNLRYETKDVFLKIYHEEDEKNDSRIIDICYYDNLYNLYYDTYKYNKAKYAGFYDINIKERIIAYKYLWENGIEGQWSKRNISDVYEFVKGALPYEAYIKDDEIEINLRTLRIAKLKSNYDIQYEDYVSPNNIDFNKDMFGLISKAKNQFLQQEEVFDKIKSLKFKNVL